MHVSAALSLEESGDVQTLLRILLGVYADHDEPLQCRMWSAIAAARGSAHSWCNHHARLTMALRLAILRVPSARQVVMTAGRPSGMAATASATAILK